MATSPRVVAIVQARLGSSRFPGKVLATIGRQAMLTHVLARAKAIPGVDAVAVTTTPRAADDSIVHICRGAAVATTRGQQPLAGDRRRNDVLAGYAVAAAAAKADVVVRLTSDCPLLDPAVAGEVLAAFLRTPCCAYASNVHPATWYDGTDVEVVRADALRHAAEVAEADEREHVTTYLWRRIGVGSGYIGVNVQAPGAANHSALKLSVDTAEDLDRVRRVWAALPRSVTRGSAPPAWRQVVAAHRAAFPTLSEVRAVRLYGRRAETAPHRAAYLAGISAEEGAGCPYSTESGSVALATAWSFGREDVLLGLIRL